MWRCVFLWGGVHVCSCEDVCLWGVCMGGVHVPMGVCACEGCIFVHMCSICLWCVTMEVCFYGVYCGVCACGGCGCRGMCICMGVVIGVWL